MHKRRLVSILIALIAVAAIIGLIWRNNQRAEKRFNVLLITLDTTRADRLGCYGYDKATTPTLDRLAANGVRYENAYTPVPLTLPSHATIMTGLNPPEHGLHDNGRGKLGPSPAVLAESFRARGYRTAAFPAAFVLDKQFGLDRGFELYDDRMEPTTADNNAYHQENPGNIIADRTVAWLKKNGADPFFAWLHFYDPHRPYHNGYDGEIAFMDAQIKRVLDCLDSRQRDKTLIVVVGDHGESLGEHRERDHGAFIYNATTHVPLILNLPGRLPEGETQSELAGLVDVAATILDVLNWPQPDGMGGQSLLGTDDTEQGIYGESEWLMNSYGWAPLYSLTTSRWKYIDAPEPELYDCVADPRELKNLTAIENAVAVEMSARLEALRAGMQTRQAETLILDAEQIARLRSLGYLGGSGAQIETGQRQDPKRMMDVFNGGQKANELQALSRHREAIALLLPLIEQSPASLELRKTIVTSYVELDELIAAKPHAEAYLRQEPQNRIIIGCVAGAFVQLGDLAQATSLYRDALRVPARPDESVGSGVTATLHRSLGQVLEMQKQLPAAAEQYEIYLNLAPDDTLIRGGLASLYGKLGVQAVDDPDAAIRYYREALELRPELTAASSNLGFVLWQEKRYGEALAVWRQGQVTYFLAFSLATCPAAKYRDGAEALRLATALCDRTQYGNARFLDALAAAHAETGRYAEAAEVARRAVEIADGVGNAGQAREIGARLQLYEAGKPFRTKTAVRRER